MTIRTSGFWSEAIASVIAWAPASTLQFGSRVSKTPPKASISCFRIAAQPCARSKPIAIGTSMTRLPASASAYIAGDGSCAEAGSAVNEATDTRAAARSVLSGVMILTFSC